MFKRTIRFYDWASVSLNSYTRTLVRVGQSYRWNQIPGDIVTPVLRDWCIPYRNTLQDTNSPIGYWVISQSGSLPSAETGLLRHRIPHENKDFKTRCLNGEIVVSPYETAFGHATSDAVLVEESRRVVSTSFAYTSFSNVSAQAAISFWKDKCPFEFRYVNTGHVQSASNFAPGNYYNIDGTEMCPWGTKGVPLIEAVESSSESFSEVTGYTPQYVLNRVHENAMRFYEDDLLIQETLAEANAGDVDALTALMEFPETVQSIIDGFKLLKRGFIEWKQKGLLIHSRVEQLSKAMSKDAWTKYRLKKMKSFPTYDRWKRRSANKGKSFDDFRFERSIFEDRLMTMDQYWVKKQNLYRRKAKHEFADALASIDLNARYNIQTNIYLLQDIAEAVWNYGVEFSRYRKRKFQPVTAVFNDLFGEGNWRFQGENSETYRAFIKRRYDVSSALKKLSRSLMADIVVTGVELIRLWSIVFDWFFTISTCLKAINWNPQYAQQGSTSSLKTELNGKLYVTDFSTSKEVSLELVYNGYKRNIINPNDSIGIRWDPNFSILRQLDALAFFWTSNRGTLKNYYAR